MPELKARFGGQWMPPVGPPGVITKGVSTSTFARGAASAYVDDDAGSWQKLVDLYPPTPTFSAVNNSGRIDLSWTISSTANLSKYEVYYSTDGVNYVKWGTEPATSATSAIFGRTPLQPPVVYRFFIRAIALNGFYRDSNVSQVTVGATVVWRAFSHSRASSGWHNRSFTFTAGLSSSTVPISRIDIRLYWRQNTSQAWSLATTYFSTSQLETTQTFTFSSYDYGQRMFRVEVTATDNQALQNNGTTGTGYTYNNAWDTTDLTAADISGGTPTISGSALGKSDPGGTSSTSDRVLRFVVGFDANVDRSEFDSAVIALYYSNGVYYGQQTVNIAALKTNQSVRQELTYDFGSLSADTAFFADFNVTDDQGVDRSVRNSQTTFATQSTSYTYVSGNATTPVTSTYHAGESIWKGSGGEFIADAPYAPAFSYSKDYLRDGNNGTAYVTASMGSAASSSVYQRIRVYKYTDYSLNSSTNAPGSVPYRINWMEFQTTQTHQITAQVYDYKSATWLGFQYPSPSDAQYYIAQNDVNGTWRLNIALGTNMEELTTVQSGQEWQTQFDIRAIMTKTKIYSGVTGYRVGLAEVRVNTTWYSRYDTYASGTYSW